MYTVKYNRKFAINYAKKWALSRNPNYYDYQGIGGDCTNFVSQCIFSGINIMNYRRSLGWYYINANDKSPSWTGVNYLHNFITSNKSVGPYGVETDLSQLEAGDFIQLSNNGSNYTHSLILTRIDNTDASTPNYYVCAHTYDVYEKNLFDYNFKTMRCVHILNGRNS